MQQDLTEVVVVLDRSGSMQSCKDDAEGGLNAFVEDQKKRPGRARLTLVQFDTEYEFVHRNVPISQVPPFTLYPRGSTALLDAVGRAINETGERLAKTHESERPALVAFVIITDGQENASHEFTRDQVKKLIQHQTETFKWQFTFLGADQNAFAEADGLGIDGAKAANYSKAKSRKAFDAASANVGRMREQTAKAEEVQCYYTAKEQAEMQDDPDDQKK